MAVAALPSFQPVAGRAAACCGEGFCDRRLRGRAASAGTRAGDDLLSGSGLDRPQCPGNRRPWVVTAGRVAGRRERSGSAAPAKGLLWTAVDLTADGLTEPVNLIRGRYAFLDENGLSKRDESELQLTAPDRDRGEYPPQREPRWASGRSSANASGLHPLTPHY